jgi:enediyne biosynthesis protein E4
MALVCAAGPVYPVDLFREIPASQSKITWVHDNGHSQSRFLPETAGPGVAIFDYNNDGWMDILLVNSGSSNFYHPSHSLRHALYRNNHDGSFTDVTAQAGIIADIYAMGVAVGDYDGDGNEDIFISGYGKCVLYHNNGNGTFTDATATSGIAMPKWATSAVWFDFDNDGKLDLFVGEFADYSALRICELADSYGGKGEGLNKEQAYYCNPRQFAPYPSHLYRNLGNGRFDDVSRATGISDSPGKVWGVVATDVNHDGYVDLFVANDTLANFLWINEGGKRFDQVGMEAGVGYSADGLARSGMGVDAGDFDNDGIPELVVSNIDAQNTSLYKDTGGGIYRDLNLQTGLAPITRMYSGWGMRFFDYDNDGWMDLIQVNGHPDDMVDLRARGVTYREPVILLHNQSGAKLDNVSSQAGPALGKDYPARGLAVGDLNNDGFPDIVFTENGGPVHVLMNNAVSGNSWLGIELRATKSNPAAVGAIIRWSSGGKVFSRIKSGGGSFLSSHDPREILGVAKGSVDWVEVQWPAPSHGVDRIEKPEMNRYLRIKEGEHPPPSPAKSIGWMVPHPHFLRVSAGTGGDERQQAQAAFQRGDFSAARDLLLHAVKESPSDPSLWFYLGASYSELREVNRAIAAFEQSRALDSRKADTHFNLGLLYWRRGDLAKAKRAYRSGLRLEPGETTAQQNLGLLLMKTGQYQEAVPLLLSLKKKRELTLPARVGLIECYLKTGQSAVASREADEIINSGIATPEDKTKLAAILVQRGAPEIAERILQNSLSMDPNQAKANAALGALYLSQKRFAEADDFFARAMQQDPESYEYVMGRARTLLAWNHDQSVVDFLNSVEPKFGTRPEFQYAKALAYYGLTQFADAAKILEKLLQTNPRRQDQINFMLGNAYLVLGKFDMAEKAYRRAIEGNPKETSYYEAFATLLRREGPEKLDYAIVELSRAHQYDPDDSRVSLQLALSYESKNRLPEAAALIEKAVQKEPGLTPAHVALGRIYYRLGKKAESQREKNIVKKLEEREQQQRISGASLTEVSDD